MLERDPRSVQDVVADTASLLNSALIDNDFARNLEGYIAELKAIDYFFRKGKNEDEAVKELKVTLESIKAKLDEIEAEKKSEMEALMNKIDELRSKIDALESKVSAPAPQNNKPEKIISGGEEDSGHSKSRSCRKWVTRLSRQAFRCRRSAKYRTDNRES